MGPQRLGPRVLLGWTDRELRDKPVAAHPAWRDRD